MYKLIFSFLLASFLVFTSCSKEDESKFEYHAHIHSPNTDNKHVGDVLDIEIEFESHTGEPVHHINVRIINKADNTEIYNKPTDAHVHATTGKHVFTDSFNLSEANGVTGHTDWILEARVWGDSPGLEEVVATVEFHVHP